MRVFQFKGLGGLLMLVMGILIAVGLLLAVPSAFMMTVWNAFIYEGLHYKEIDLLQGFMLWVATIGLLKIVFQPQIEFQLHNVKPGKLGASKKAQPKAGPEEIAPMEEAPQTPADQQG